MSDTDNILNTDPGNNGELDQERLMAYLEGKLTPEEQHEVERWMDTEGMESDALEGLKMLPAEETRHVVTRLNHNLGKTIKHKKKRRGKPGPDIVTWVTIFTILLLAVVAFLVIRLLA